MFRMDMSKLDKTGFVILNPKIFMSKFFYAQNAIIWLTNTESNTTLKLFILVLGKER